MTRGRMGMKAGMIEVVVRRRKRMAGVAGMVVVRGKRMAVAVAVMGMRMGGSTMNSNSQHEPSRPSRRKGG